MLKIKKNFLGLISLIVPFSYSFYYICSVIFKFQVTSLSLKVFCSSIALIGYFSYFFFLFSSKKILKHDLYIILPVILVPILLLLTKFFYNTNSRLLIGSLNSFLIRGAPSILLAHILAKRNEISKMIDWLQPLVLFYSVACLMAALAPWNTLLIYQDLSYFSMFAFALNLFIIQRELVVSANRKKIILIPKLLNIISALINIYCMFAGGGRGAFVLFFVLLITFVIFNRGSIKGYKFIIFFLTVLFFIIILTTTGALNIFSSSVATGLERITRFFNENNNLQSDERYNIYKNSWDLFKDAPFFGHGIGSVFIFLNGYSHNIFLDILIDFGIFGFLFFFINIIWIFEKNSDIN
ncbi:O-antigen ligase family protein [Streptococcus uberis]|uniref:O-antigen ligase family protein n=1 Tax=Streptococcus uberis TaxID=1349 RepID=UPI001FF3D7D3|nr:O-antigen ligase family protein [Streptococcus uberis]MCK1191804.1 O-antigen ligase family protein [Streptococcus uberis]MCK1239233.1 O-antigen ligase family protein [Streptococcus uberis]